MHMASVLPQHYNRINILVHISRSNFDIHKSIDQSAEGSDSCKDVAMHLDFGVEYQMIDCSC